MIFRRKHRGPDIGTLIVAGEMVTVRAHAGYRADEEPRALVIGGTEIPIDEILWRAQVEEAGVRSRAFVVRVGDRRVRLSLGEDDLHWSIARVWTEPTPDQGPA